MEFTVLSVLELHPQSPTAAMLKLGIVVVCAYTISKLLLILLIFTKTRARNANIVMMVPYLHVKLQFIMSLN
jgi:hypothetical protein